MNKQTYASFTNGVQNSNPVRVATLKSSGSGFISKFQLRREVVHYPFEIPILLQALAHGCLVETGFRA